ncbi:MAG: hypothetical protein ITG02_06345 [Patulibacter sp.]|nr:hypothetical protein [Patulibacter sp.]
MRSKTRRLRRVALILTGLAVAIGIASIIGIFWVAGRTDTHLLCDPGFAYEGEEPWQGPGVCAFYDAPFWTLGVAAVCAAGALLTFVAELVLPVRPSNP